MTGALVHLDQPDGRAVRQRRTAARPSCTRPTRRATDRLRRPDRRWRHRDHDAAAEHPRLREARPVPVNADNKGDVDKAKDELKACGKPDGFETTIAFRTNRPKEKATRRGAPAGAGKVGIKVDVKRYPTATTSRPYAGKPTYVDEEQARPDRHRLGCRLERRLRLPAADRRQPGHPADRRLPTSSVTDPEVDKLFDKALGRARPGQARRRSAARSTRRSWRRPSICRSSTTRRCCYAATNADQRVRQPTPSACTTTTAMGVK